MSPDRLPLTPFECPQPHRYQHSEEGWGETAGSGRLRALAPSKCPQPNRYQHSEEGWGETAGQELRA